MIRTFAQNQIGAWAGWQNIFFEIDQVNRVPDARGSFFGLRITQRGIAMEIGVGVFECAVAQAEEAFNVPSLEVDFFGVNED